MKSETTSAADRINVSLLNGERTLEASFLSATWRIEHGGVLTILDSDGLLIASYAPGRWLSVVMG